MARCDAVDGLRCAWCALMGEDRRATAVVIFSPSHHRPLCTRHGDLAGATNHTVRLLTAQDVLTLSNPKLATPSLWKPRKDR